MTLLNNLARDDCSHPPPSPLATIAQMWLSPRARERGLLPHTRFGDWASTLNLAMVATPFATTVLTSASNPLSSSLCLLSFYFFYYISSFFSYDIYQYHIIIITYLNKAKVHLKKKIHMNFPLFKTNSTTRGLK